MRIGLTALIEEDRTRRRSRRGLAIIDGSIDLALREVDQHVATTANIAGARIGHRQREAGRDCGIDRVASLLEYIDADAYRAAFLRHHHAMGCRNRLDPRAACGRGIVQHRRLCRERGEPAHARDQGEHRTADNADHRTLQDELLKTSLQDSRIWYSRQTFAPPSL